MSSFNATPPPPPFGASKWEQRAYRRQVKAANRQARWQMTQQRLQQRAQRKLLRTQMRLARRHSLAGPILLVTLGVLFLLGEMGRIAVATLAGWYGRWWPLLLIAIGAVLLAEWAWDTHNALPGDPPQRRTLGALGTLLVIGILLTGGGAMAAMHGADWARVHVDPQYRFSGLDSLLGHHAVETSTLESTIAANGHLLVRNPHGGIDVSGTSTDGQIHLTSKREAHGWDEQQLNQRLARLAVSFEGDDQQRSLTIPEVDSSTADLELTVPREVTVELEGRAGQVSVRDIHAPVTVAGGSGGVDLTAITGRVQLTLSDDDGSVTAHSVTGDVTVQGRAGDINVSDLRGALSLHGDFFGTTQLERIDGLTHFQTSRTDVQIARIDGSLTIESGSDLSAEHLAGPVTIATHDRNITLDGVNGPIDIENRNGSVTVNTVAPAAPIRIGNKNGDTEIGIPEDSAATLALSAKNGELSNEFDLKNGGSEDSPSLNASLKGGGPRIAVAVSNGNLSLKHSSAEAWKHEAEPKLRTEPASPDKKASGDGGEGHKRDLSEAA